MSNEPKKTTNAPTTLGWSPVQQDPWSGQIHVHHEYVEQARTHQQQVQQYTEDPYNTLKAHLEQQQPRTNAHVQPRSARGSQQPLHDERPTTPYAGPHVVEHMQQQMNVSGQGYAVDGHGHGQQVAQPAQPAYGYDAQANLMQYANTAAYVQEPYGYDATSNQYHQTHAAQPNDAAATVIDPGQPSQGQGYDYAHAQAGYYNQAVDQAQYAQQAYAQQAYAQQAYAQQQQQAYAQQPYAYDPQAQYAQAYYAQQAVPGTQQEIDAYVRAQYAYGQQADHAVQAQQAYEHAAAQQQVQQAQAQTQQPSSGNYLGAMAAKLQNQAEGAVGSSKKKKAKKARPISNADATVGASARRRFIKKTYFHLFGAIGVFAALLWVFMNVGAFQRLFAPFIDFALRGRWNWGVVLAAYMGASLIADRWASNAKSRFMQYAGLGFYVLAEAVIFVPLLWIVQVKTASIVASGGGDPNIVRDAAFLTLGTFGVLTLSILISKKDFSFLRSGLYAASGAALTLIVLSLVFGFNLGLVFSLGMVVLAAGYILFHTSQVLAHYDPESHVAAALALFSSLALMFWYMIRILMRARD